MMTSYWYIEGHVEGQVARMNDTALTAEGACDAFNKFYPNFVVNRVDKLYDYDDGETA